jgi:hypothetical protein
MTIANTGGPSVIDGYRMRLNLPSGWQINALTEDAPPPLPFRVNRDGRVYDSTENSLFDKTSQTPITTGNKVTGMLVFNLNGIKADQLVDDMDLIIEFHDVVDRPFYAFAGLKKGEDHSPYVPGLKIFVGPLKA